MQENLITPAICCIFNIMFKQARLQFIKIKKSNKNYKKHLASYYLKSKKGECIYEIIINNKSYICVHRGSLYTSLKYHIERALRDWMGTIKENNNSFHTYVGKNGFALMENFFKNGGDIKLIEENINKKNKRDRETYYIQKFWKTKGKNKVWNLQK